MSSTNDKAAVPSDIVNKSSVDNTSTSLPENVDSVLSDKTIAISPDNANKEFSDPIITASSDDVNSAHAPTVTTSSKRKQSSVDAQEQALESSKKPRRLNDFEYIRNTFGYTFKDLNLLDEALDTTSAYRAQSNQSLALIGDSILQTIIYRDWYPSKQLKGM